MTSIFAPSRPKHEHTRSGGSAATLLVFACVAYVLSPPAAFILLAQMPPHIQASVERFLEIVYSPLQWMYDSCAAVEKFYDWYNGLFGF